MFFFLVYLLKTMLVSLIWVISQLGHENYTKFGDGDMGQGGWDQGFPFSNPFSGGAEDVST